MQLHVARHTLYEYAKQRFCFLHIETVLIIDQRHGDIIIMNDWSLGGNTGVFSAKAEVHNTLEVYSVRTKTSTCHFGSFLLIKGGVATTLGKASVKGKAD